ncbi:sensor histidine kinase [Algoriphagus winogradskyi]|uniref:histidine kinase n=1 Tax=Algoriphagus winogradskyi TaxID=237017 RepID=A0ABY1PIC5_9BACT|nr:7TM diverse intracellular signaling domain-containing protein [Algoriphagus winogradskyi]SMP34296.1 hypothetical protein SAMN06265367_109148 [Algoriphagus winogradskyi]
MIKYLYFFLALVLLSSCKEQSKNQFEFIGWVSENQGVNSVEDFIALPNSSLENSEGEFLSLGYSDASFWIRVVLTEVPKNSGKQILSLSNPMLNEIEVYNAEGVLVKKMGRVNVADQDFNSLFNFADISEDKSLTYNVKVKSFGNVNVPISLNTDTKNYLTLDERNLIFGIYFGIILAMFFYNLFLWISTRDSLYGLYITYIFFVGVTQGILGGYVDAFVWPSSVFLKEYGFYISTALVNIVGIFYSLSFLKTKVFNKKLYAIGVSIIVVYVFILSAFLFDFGIGQLKFRFLQVFLGIVPFYLLFISSYSLARGYRPAKFFLISWSLLICSMIVFLLGDLNILPNSFFTSYVFTFGSVFEALLLSFALADKINILKKEKEKEQAERLLILAKNEQLVREQNVMLEDKVKIRTDELEQALRNLQNTQSQLVNQEKMASLGQLTAGIAHEINNPINFVSSNIMPLKRDIKDIMEVIEFYRTTGAREFTPESQQEAKQLEEDLELEYVLDEVDQLLKGMDDGAKRTVEIVKGLRLFSRVDEQDMKKVDVHDGINSTIILLNSTMPTKIRIVRDFGELPLVECLAGKINQVFMNIINNAVHALADHIDTIVDPKIELRTRSLEDFITIEIIDNGPGMPDNVKQRIFEPFFTTKAVGKGTGLGLSIVYSIIENHKGTLEVITEEGQGTTFKITLPIYQSSQRYE